MSSLLQIACGWGMPVADFLARTGLPIRTYENGRPSILATLIEPMDEVRDLRMPHETWRRLYDDRLGISCLVDDLLKGGLTGAVRERDRQPWQHQARCVSDLIERAGSGDEPDVLLFWPDYASKRRLCRRGDDLDYVLTLMDQAVPGRERADAAADLISPLVHNPYPWCNDLQKDGQRVAWPGPFGIHTYPDHAPAPPKELVWWLGHLGILDEPDAMALRPYLCRWWH